MAESHRTQLPNEPRDYGRARAFALERAAPKKSTSSGSENPAVPVYRGSVGVTTTPRSTETEMTDQIQVNEPGNATGTSLDPMPGLRKTGGTRQLILRSVLARGWTRMMVDDLLGEPDDRRDNPKYRSAAPMRLYDYERIVAAEATPEFADRLEKANARRRGRDYTPALVKKYGDPKGGLLDAAEAMFALNRYAKHDTCTRKHQTEIYDLKNRFVSWLVVHGHLVGWGTHEIVQPERDLECYCVSRYGEDGCHRCDYTGVHRTLPERVLGFVVLRFSIGGKTYTWHQPDDYVTFDYANKAPKIDTAGDDWTPEREKPIEMPRSQFARAKALVRWVMTVLGVVQEVAA